MNILFNLNLGNLLNWIALKLENKKNKGCITKLNQKIEKNNFLITSSHSLYRSVIAAVNQNYELSKFAPYKSILIASNLHHNTS